MEKHISMEKAISMAIEEAERKFVQGKLIKINDLTENGNFPEDFLYEIDNGDFETIYSLASLYSQFCQDQRVAETEIEIALSEIYPQYL